MTAPPGLGKIVDLPADYKAAYPKLNFAKLKQNEARFMVTGPTYDTQIGMRFMDLGKPANLEYSEITF